MKLKQSKKFPYTPFSSYCLRLPTLPFDFLKNLTSSQDIEDAILIEKFRIPVVQEAIFLASPEFYNQIVKWSNGDIKDVGKQERVRRSFLKYLSRMASRCTPFGLFAHCSTGAFAKESRITPLSNEAYTKVTRYDMHFLVLFSNYLTQKKHIREQLLFYPNSSLYQIGDRYRYVEYQYEGKRRVHSLESVLHSPYLENLIASAEKGAPVEELSKVLVHMGIDEETASGFVQELIENQILLSTLEPTLTGDDFLIQLEQKLKRMKGVSEELGLIQQMKKHLSILDQHVGSPIAPYYDVQQLIRSLDIEFDPKYLLQTDMFSSAIHNTLGEDTLENIKEGVVFLNKISNQLPNENLNRFKSTFIERYEHERIPLLQALDVETGIGYIQNPNSIEATPFLDDLVMPMGTISELQQYSWSPLQQVMHKKLSNFSSGIDQIIELKDSDFEKREPDWKNAPDTFSALIEVIHTNDTEYVSMNHLGGSSAANLIARFSYGDSGLLALANEITAKEADLQPDKILTEIIHLPESRTGNVLRRPHLRAFEIPCLGKSDMPLEQQIPLSDLEISVSYEKIRLYSKKHGKEIVPKLTNAHNYSFNALPVYHFLCDLQQQNIRSYGFGWSSFFDQYDFLPRVVYKQIILSKARWHIKKEMIHDLVDTLKTEELQMDKLLLWRGKHHIPQWVQLVDGDNTLTVNFNNKNSTLMLFETVKNRSRFVLEEFLFSDDTLVKNNQGNYANQVVLAFHKTSLTAETNL